MHVTSTIHLQLHFNVTLRRPSKDTPKELSKIPQLSQIDTYLPMHVGVPKQTAGAVSELIR